MFIRQRDGQRKRFPSSHGENLRGLTPLVSPKDLPLVLTIYAAVELVFLRAPRLYFPKSTIACIFTFVFLSLT